MIERIEKQLSMIIWQLNILIACLGFITGSLLGKILKKNKK